MNEDALFEDALWPWLADDSMADHGSLGGWDGEGPDAADDWATPPDTFLAAHYGDADEAFRAARDVAEGLAAEGIVGAGWRIAPHGADGWRIVGPDGGRYRVLTDWHGGRE